MEYKFTEGQEFAFYQVLFTVYITLLKTSDQFNEYFTSTAQRYYSINIQEFHGLFWGTNRDASYCNSSYCFFDHLEAISLSFEIFRAAYFCTSR